MENAIEPKAKANSVQFADGITSSSQDENPSTPATEQPETKGEESTSVDVTSAVSAVDPPSTSSEQSKVGSVQAKFCVGDRLEAVDRKFPKLVVF